MNETHYYEGRANPAIIVYPAEAILADPGHVFSLVLAVGEMKIGTYYTRMAVINYWGMRVVNPFRRLSYRNLNREFADYLPKDLFVFCHARLQMIPEEEWMLRNS